MDPISVVRRYAEAWNAHDPAGVQAVFTEGGTYEDPTTGGPVSGDAIAGTVQGLLTMLPDLAFDIVSIGAVEGTPQVVMQWVMRGTNTGPLPGGPPLGKTVALPGVDVIVVEGDKVASVQGYFDMATTFRQLGLAVDPYPAEALGPFNFGSAV